MSPRRFGESLLVILILGLAGCAVVSSPFKSQTAQDRPNVLFILTDDLRHDALGATGNPSVSTPNLDLLASQGLTLNRFYVASPRCHPSRASFLSGRYPHQEQIVEEVIGYHVREGTPTVATRLNRAGYTTGFVGKAHLGGRPQRWGFQEVPAYTEQARAFTDDLKVRDRRFVVRTGEGDTKTRFIGKDTTRFLVDRSMQFVEQNRNRPWFLWLATTAPHAPYFYSGEHPYDLPDTHVPPGFPPGDLGAADDAVDSLLRQLVEPGSDAYRRGKALFENLWSKYYSNVSTLDHQIGRLMKRLRETGQAQNTVVILTSDNGIMHGSHRIMNKGVWYEEATRVPAIVRWPGVVEPGRTSPALVSSVDFLPTVLDLAGRRPAPEASSGRSFLPVLREGHPVRDHVYSESRRLKVLGGGFWQMVRGDRFKYVRFRERKETHLYDLVNDPHEQNDLAHDTRYRTVRERLDRSLTSWLERTP